MNQKTGLTISTNELLPHCSSEPDLHNAKLEQSLDRTVRQKRKCESDTTMEIKSLRDDIMTSIRMLRNEQREKFSMQQQVLDQIKTQNLELQSTVEFLSTRYDELLNRVAVMDQDEKDRTGYIKSLEERVESIERKAKSTGLDIRNVPKVNSETREDLIKIVQSIGNAVNTEIDTHCLMDVYRSQIKGNHQGTGPISVQFTSILIRDKLLASVKSYNRENKFNRLNSSHAGMAGNTPIFVSESLTNKAGKLYHKTRMFAKENNYKYHWTSHGQIFLKKGDGMTTKRINEESDLVGPTTQKT